MVGQNVSHMDNQTYACVKWLTGAYKNTITHDVKVDWILEFDGVRDESYAIEWRVQPKPRAGWKVFDGVVLEASGKYNTFSITNDVLR